MITSSVFSFLVVGHEGWLWYSSALPLLSLASSGSQSGHPVEHSHRIGDRKLHRYKSLSPEDLDDLYDRAERRRDEHVGAVRVEGDAAGGGVYVFVHVPMPQKASVETENDT